MRQIINNIKLLGLVLVLIPTIPVYAANDSQTFELEEIVVTARKREESLQDVPISIVTLSGDELRKNGVQRMDYLAATVPNLHYSHTPSAVDLLYVRGIGSAVNFGFETAVGMVVDGFYYGKTKIGRSAFLDLERIEILKGPQGAVLGKNNSAGAVNMTTAKPTDEFEGAITLTGNFEGNRGYSTEGYVSGPLTDKLRGRVSMRYDNYDGFIKNVIFDENEQTMDDWTGRAILMWDANEDIEVMASYQRVDFTHRGQGRELFACGPLKSLELVGVGFPTPDCQLDFKKASSGVPGTTTRDKFDQELDMAHLSIKWDVLGHTLTSQTGFMQYKTNDAFDSDNTPTVKEWIIIPEDYEQWLQEFRIIASHERFEYLFGTLLLFSEQGNEFHFQLNQAGLDLVAAGNQENTTVALFGELTFHLTDNVDTIFGARYTYEKKELSQEFYAGIPFTSTRLGPSFYDLSPERSENRFTPMVDVRWTPNDDMMFYGSVRTGFRGGGFDRFMFETDPVAAAGRIEFEEETVISYEIGAKLELFDNKMRLNMALFRSEYDDLQLSAFVTATTFRVDNVGSATSQGFELGLDWQATERLLLNAGLGILDAKFSDFRNAGCYNGQTVAEGCNAGGTTGQDLTGRTLPYAPDLSASISATFTWPIAGNMILALFGQLNHSSSMFIVSDLDPAYLQDSYQLLNARLALSNTAETWEVAFIGRNLTDELVMTYGSDTSPDGRDAFLLPPLVLGVQGTFRF